MGHPIFMAANRMAPKRDTRRPSALDCIVLLRISAAIATFRHANGQASTTRNEEGECKPDLR